MVRRGVVGVIVALLLLVPASSQAGNRGSNVASGDTPAHPCDKTTASQCVANDGVHRLQSFSVTASWQTALDWAAGQWDADATVQVFWVTSNPDVQIFDFNYGLNNLWGWTTCTDEASFGGVDPNRYCRPSELDLNEAYSQTASQKQSIACHELGHSLGLRHSNESSGSCMIKNQRTISTISSHDHSMLAAQY